METNSPTAMDVEDPTQKEKINNTIDTPINIEEGTPTPPKNGRKKSYVWDHFTTNKDPKYPRVICKYFGVSYARQQKRNGTNNMRAHLESQCNKYPLRFNREKQSMLNFAVKCDGSGNANPTVSLKTHVYKYEECRKALAKMIICDELSFRFVEGEGFIAYSKILEPRFTIPTRVTIAKDCMQIYGEEKVKLKSMLKDQRVCLTSDAWTSIQNINYMCLTAHWIDSNWNLNKRIINFRQIANHKGVTVGRCIESWLLEWGIEKIFTLTLDNASSNSLAIEELKRKTKRWKHTISENQFLHVRCCAHILNLVVQDDMTEEDASIIRIRNAVRYVRSSPSRLLSFDKCLEKEKIKSKGKLCLDVETRWNSTYMMLEIAEKYEKVFVRLGEDDSKYLSYFNGRSNIGPPSEFDWRNARTFLKFLRMFYQVTLKFSGSLYVTSNVFFHEIVEIHTRLSSLILSQDPLLSSMATRMKCKFEKYWDNYKNINFLLYIVVVLDPRFKLRYVHFCFSQMYSTSKCTEMVVQVENNMNKLFHFYEEEHINGKGGSSNNIDVGNHENACERSTTMSMAARFLEQIRENEVDDNKSDLCKYLSDALVNDPDNQFDILNWWKLNSSKYPILSKMAKSVLSVPVSTVASESAFSTGGRILNSYRSSLRPRTVEALVCAQNWLRSRESTFDLRDVITELDSVEEIASEFVHLNIDEDLDFEVPE